MGVPFMKSTIQNRMQVFVIILVFRSNLKKAVWQMKDHKEEMSVNSCGLQKWKLKC